MNDMFLIPANSKKSMLILGLFNKFDLTLFLIGIGVTLILFLVLPIENLTFAIISILPAAVCAFLVMPVPNYHNVLTFLLSLIEFYTTRQRFVWKGWCVLNGEEYKE